MWEFLEIFGTLFYWLCCGEQERQYSRDYESLGTTVNRNRNENPCGFLNVPKCDEFSRTSPTISTHFKTQFNAQSYREVPNRGEFLRRTSPTISTHFKSQSNAHPTTQIQSQSRLNSSKLPLTPTTSSFGANWMSDNLPLLEPLITTAPKTKTVTKDLSIKPETSKGKPEKSSEIFEKPKVLPPSSTPSYASQKRIIESDANRTPEPKLSCKSSPFSSQSSPSSSKLPTFSSEPSPSSSKPSPSLSGPPLSSLKPDLSSSSSSSSSCSFRTFPPSPKPFPLSNKPTLSHSPFIPTIQQKKPDYIWVEKLKVLPPSSTPSYASQKRTIEPEVNRTPEPKLSCKSPPFSSQSSPSSTKLTPFASVPSLSSSKPSPSLSGSPLSSLKPDSSSSSSSSSSRSSGTFRPSPKPLRVSNKPTLFSPFNPIIQQGKTNYIWVEKGTSPIYMIPEDVENLIKRDIVPGILKKPLSPSTYQDYFRALLNAEDYYLEKWDGFEMEDVTLELHEAAIYCKKGKYKNLDNDWEDNKVFVAFEIDSVPAKRPFLQSRDFASVWPSGREVEPFQGIIYRVVKSNLVLVEFGEDFHSQHYSTCKYDVKFSFNRICLKRAHQAIETASDPLFKNFLFPDCDSLSNINPLSTKHLSIDHTLGQKQVSAVYRIYSHCGPPPYLVAGPLCVNRQTKQPSTTGEVILEAVLHIYRTEPHARILICAPTNRTCDVIVESLQEEIPESAIFRANAAFRELDVVPLEILPSCRYEDKEECFSCPSLEELRKFKVIVSTYMSCFRLHNEGLVAGDFSQIFMLDASSTTEPEAMVALVNLADERTDVVVTGEPGNCSAWVRSKIARENGLRRSYFERLYESKLYRSLDPRLVTQL